MFPEQKISILE